MANTLSICMIVKNEAKMLTQCLRSAAACAHEIIVVDTGSADNTIEIARSFNAIVIQEAWRNDFAYSRNVSIKHAAGDWILWLDADDFVPAESIQKIRELTRQKPDKVFGFIVRNQKPNNTGSEFMQARMFPRRPDIYFERKIHEQIMLSALRAGLMLVHTPVVIEHLGYASADSMSAKSRRNLALLLESYHTNEPDPVTAVEIADGYMILDEKKEAADWYETVLRIPEVNRTFAEIAAQAHRGLGEIAGAKGEHEGAIGQFSEALKLAPRRSDVRYGFAVALELAGRKAQAIDCLKAVLRQKETVGVVGVDFREAATRALLRLARLLQEDGRAPEAEKLIAEWQIDYADRPEVFNLAGCMYLRQHKLMEALHAFEKSFTIGSLGNINATIGLCGVYCAAGKSEIALVTLKAKAEEFRDVPRFWALVKLLNSPLDIPAAIDSADLEREMVYIKETFGLTENL